MSILQFDFNVRLHIFLNPGLCPVSPCNVVLFASKLILKLELLVSGYDVFHSMIFNNSMKTNMLKWYLIITVIL